VYLGKWRIVRVTTVEPSLSIFIDIVCFLWNVDSVRDFGATPFSKKCDTGPRGCPDPQTMPRLRYGDGLVCVCVILWGSCVCMCVCKTYPLTLDHFVTIDPLKSIRFIKRISKNVTVSHSRGGVSQKC
jgi:hypothetical protein